MEEAQASFILIPMGEDNQGIFYMWNGNVLKEFNGINENAFDPELLLKSLDYK